VRLFAGENYSSVCALVNYRVKKLAYNCIRAIHHNRFALLIYFNSLILGFWLFLFSCHYFPLHLLLFLEHNF